MVGDCGHFGESGVPCTIPTLVVTFCLETLGVSVGATRVFVSEKLFSLDKLIRLLFVFGSFR